ncbi:heterokaryon incompatibility protein-domain-containing protein [Xylariaceae sp. FL1019]|nr:heterokaryon incompatibility protein-domain-containing protein [Xylariaceae sp. FL1019]
MARFIPGRWDRLLSHLKDQDFQSNPRYRSDQVQVCPGCHCSIINGLPDLDALYQRRQDESFHLVIHADWKYIARAGCLLCRIAADVAKESAWARKTRKIFNIRGNLDDLRDLDISRDRGNDERYVLELCGSFYSNTVWVLFDEDASLELKCVPYWEIPRRNTLSYSLKIAREWLSACEGHENCDTSTTQSFSFTPRFIELGVGKMRLVERDVIQGGYQYVALSHCWGKVKPIQALTTNVDSLKEEILLSLLPRSFREAIAICRGLQYQYIWIDALCIIQDDELDWKQQSCQMDSIYAGAHLVLSAASATDSSEGFLNKRRLFQERSGTIRIDRIKRTIPYKLRLTHEHGPSDPIDRRAWCLQERLCARRYLAFGEEEMLWHCNTTSTCECRWMSSQTRSALAYSTSKCPVGSISTLERVLSSGAPTSSIWLPSHTGETVRWQDSSTERTTELMNRWVELIVPPYAFRELTLHSDRLAAISAVASQFQARTNDVYLAGLWKCDLVRQLLWHSLEEPLSRHCKSSKDNSPHNLPSWSWASVKGAVLFPYRPEKLSTQEEIQIVSAETVLSSPKSCGPVSNGIIHLRGRLVSVELVEETVFTRPWWTNIYTVFQWPRWRFNIFLPSREHVRIHGERFGEIYFDDRPGPTGSADYTTIHNRRCVLDMEKLMPLWILPVLTQRNNDRNAPGYRATVVLALLLRSSMKSEGCFERVGFVDCDISGRLETWKEILDQYHPQGITLV